VIAADVFGYGWWIAARAAGIVAILLVSASVGLGLAMATKPERRRPGMAVVLRRLHQYVALGALVAIAFHGLFLLLDPWLRPGLAGVAVPFALGYRTFFTGLGVIAAWSAAALGLSYWLRDRIGRERWTTIHRLTLAAYALALIHVIGAGTDGGSAWLLAILALALLPLPTLAVRRLLSHEREQERRAAARARAATRRPAAAGPDGRRATPRRPVGHGL